MKTAFRRLRVAADAARSYGRKCRRAPRQFVHIQPDWFVVYDRVATDVPRPVEYLLPTENEPAVTGPMLRADSRGGRLYQETILPRGATLGKVGGPGKEWWANGRNWEVDEKYLESAKKTCARVGRGPYFGAWRVEVRAPKAAARAFATTVQPQAGVLLK